MVAKTKDVDLPRLYDSIERDYRSLQPYRENLFVQTSEAAGSHYSDYPTAQIPVNPENPVNLLSLWERIMMGHLVGASPRMLVSTDDPAMRHFARPFEQWGNRQLKRMHFGDILRRWVKDALYSIGIVKCSITAPTEARFGGYEKKAGEIGLSNIDLEDWVWDMRAKKPSECWYMGHRYTALYEQVKNSKMFNADARRKVQERDELIVNMGGDLRIGQIGRGPMINQQSYQKYVELWEIYMPLENVIVTFDADGDLQTPLLVQEWVGPACGPYYFLRYGDVTGNLMPKAPAMDLLDTHRSFNHLRKKCDNRASEEKTIFAYSNQEDAKKMEKAMDGDYVQLSNPKESGEVRVKSGPDQQVSVWATETERVFNKLTGNMDSVGGLTSVADTARQEEMMHQSSSQLVNAMSLRTVEGTQEVLNGIGWFAWKNPRIVMTSRYSPPGAPNAAAIQTKTPMDRFQQPFEEIDLRIDPYSFVSPTPQAKLQLLQGVMKDFIIPLLPMFGQPGVGDMLQEYVHMVAKLSNTQELNELLEKLVGIEGPPEQAVDGNAPAPSPEPNQTTRISRPGMTDQGHQQVLAQLMAGGQPQQGAGGMGLGQMRAG